MEVLEETDFDKLKLQLENAENYSRYLEKQYDQIRSFKHDFENIITSISGYIALNDFEGLKKYFSEFQKDYSIIKNSQFLNTSTINDSAVYSLIVSKYQRALDLGIDLNFDIFFDFKTLKISIYEFCRVIGILLDNAIEAAAECKEKQVNLSFRNSQRQNVQIFVVENTYLDKSLDTDKIFIKGKTSKENHSGLGLWEVNNIIGRSNNVSLNTSKDFKFFKQELQVF